MKTSKIQTKQFLQIEEDLSILESDISFLSWLMRVSGFKYGSIKNFARFLDTSYQTVFSWKKKLPHLSTLASLSEKLGIDKEIMYEVSEEFRRKQRFEKITQERG